MTRIEEVLRNKDSGREGGEREREREGQGQTKTRTNLDKDN